MKIIIVIIILLITFSCYFLYQNKNTIENPIKNNEIKTENLKEKQDVKNNEDIIIDKIIKNNIEDFLEYQDLDSDKIDLLKKGTFIFSPKKTKVAYYAECWEGMCTLFIKDSKTLKTLKEYNIPKGDDLCPRCLDYRDTGVELKKWINEDEIEYTIYPINGEGEVKTFEDKISNNNTNNNSKKIKDKKVVSATKTNNDIKGLTSIEKPRVRLVILNTADKTATQEHINRLRDIGKYVENFYVKELREKGCKLNNTKMFARNTDGDILVYTVKSNKSSSEISNIISTGVELAKTKYPDLTDLNTIWAIVHFNDKGGFTGGGKINKGRMKFQLKDFAGAIDFDKNMSETGYHRNISLKAIAHELGHALTLSHNGPLMNNKSFNTMMGPVQKAYEKTVGVLETKDVKLSDYTASIVAYHPIFRDVPFDISQLAGKKLKIEKIEGDKDLFNLDCSTDSAHIRGKVVSDLPFHHIVVRFSYDSLKKKGYWNKSFSITPDKNGIFDLQLTKNDINIGSAKRNDFKYEVMVVFDNGLSTGVKQLDENEEITVNKNQYISDYSFNINSSFCR